MPELNKLLEENGYNPYSMPDRDFVPLAIVKKNEYDRFVRKGLLPDFVQFPPGTFCREPQCLPPENKPQFSNTNTSQLDASLGVSLLRNIFAQIGLGSFTTNITFNKVKKIELSYNNVISDSIDTVQIAKYISPPAAPPPPGRVLDELEVKRTYIIYDILKSNSFKIKCYSKDAAGAKTEIEALKNIFKDQSNINITYETDNSLIFEGPGYQTFAVRIRPFWVNREDNSFFFKERIPSIFDNIWGRLKGVGPMGRSPVPSRGFDYASLPGSEPSPLPEIEIQDDVLFPPGAFYKFDW